MAKDRERRAAFDLYVKQGKTAKDTAELVGVTESTLGKWVDKYNWKEARTAKQATNNKLEDDIKRLMQLQVEKRLEIQEQLEDCSDDEEEGLLKRAAVIGDEISKLNKTIETISKGNKITLSTYLEVMNRIFNALQTREPKLFMELLEFQQQHIQEIAKEIG